jgi:hypothetical protein
MEEGVAATSEVAPNDAIACLNDARVHLARFFNEPRPPLHALLAAQLFEAAIEDYTRAANGATYRPEARSLNAALEIIVKKRSFSLGDFRGNKSVQKELAHKLHNLEPYVTANGTLLRIVGPAHKRGHAVDLYFTVCDASSALAEPRSPAEGLLHQSCDALPTDARAAFAQLCVNTRRSIGLARLVMNALDLDQQSRILLLSR